MLYAGPKLENAAGTDAFAAGGGSGAENLSVFRQVRAIDATARYLLPDTVLPSTSTVTLAAGRIYYMPFSVGLKTDGLVFEVTTAGTAGSTARMGIYACDANGLPGALIDQGASTVAITTTGLKVVTLTTLVIDQPCWVALTVSASCTVRAGAADNTGLKRVGGQVNLTTNGPIYGVQNFSSSYASLPSTATSNSDYNSPLTLGIRGAV